MDRLFLDVNVLFSAAYKPGARLLELWKLAEVVLCGSRYALEEAKFNLADDDQLRRLTKLSQSLLFFEAGQREMPKGISIPEKDAPILLAAIEAKADYLLTGDIRHFGQYLGRKIGGVTVMLPGQYLKLKKR